MSDTPTFDFDFRPDYWEPAADPITAITRNVKGQLRREMIADIVSGRAAERAPDEATRQLLSEVHPDLLGLGRRFLVTARPVVDEVVGDLEGER